MSTRIITVASALVVAAGLVTGAVGTAALAGAIRDGESTYFSLLADYGIEVTDPALAIKNAYTICAMLDEGYPVSDVMDGLAAGENESDPAYLTGYITAATTVYCAEHL